MFSKGKKKIVVPEPPATTIDEIEELLKPSKDGDSGYAKLDPQREEFLRAQKEAYDKGRFLDRISILLIGSSGIGKSSTINNLFNLEMDSEDAAKTSDVTSETRSVTEYELPLDLPDRGIKDIKIGIVDSPGFNDTDGVKQDACNFYAIKKFYETHPSKAGRDKIYPNLIFVTIPASDSRIEGENSLLSKSLRSLAQLDLVDKKCPNVVGVITKAAQFSRDKKAWKEDFNKMRDTFKRILFKYFEVTADIVALENFPARERLTKKQDYYLLPDKETLQPKNLFKACKYLMCKSGDPLGYFIFVDGFNTRKMKSQPGFSVEATIANQGGLTKEEKEVSHLMMHAAEGKNTDQTLSDHALTFIIENALQGTDEEELILSICLELQKYDITKPEHISSKTKNDICIIMGKDLLPKSKAFLDKLGVQDGDPASLDDSMILIGQGYNVLTDRPVPLSILKFSSRSTKMGVQIPEPAKIDKINQTRFFMLKFNNKEDYFKNRQKSLNISLEINLALLNTSGRAGFSLSDATSQSSSSEEHSFLVEQRLFQVSIPALEGLQFASDFIQHVQDLPKVFNIKDADNRSSYENFFNTFGHFVVLEAFAGGSIIVRTNKDTSSGKSFDETKQELAASFNTGIMGIFQTSGQRDNKTTTEWKQESILDKSLVEFNGGDTELHANSTITDPEMMTKWKISLGSNLAMLDTQLSLTPISSVVQKIDKEKGDECQKALKHFLGGEFKVVASEEKLQLEMLKREKEKAEWLRTEREKERQVFFTRDQDVKAEKENYSRLWSLIGYGWLWGGQ